MVYVIILAAGKSERFQIDNQKCLAILNDRPVFAHSLFLFNKSKSIDNIFLVVNQNDFAQYQTWCQKLNLHAQLVIGGQQRFESLFNGLRSIKKIHSDDIIVTHDAARPNINLDQIEQVINCAKKFKYSSLGYYSSDTLVEIDSTKFIKHDRNKILHAQTPQACKYDCLKNIDHDLIQGSTDLLSLLNLPIKKNNIVFSDENNRKITYKEDLFFLQKILH